jgi:excinuclease ABC subunit A
VIKSADRLIDLGPEGGEEGGLLVAQGTPEQVAGKPGSHTGRFLAQIVKPAAPRKRRSPRSKMPAAA